MVQEIFYDLRPEQISGKEVVLVKGEGQASVSVPKRPRNFDYVAETLFPTLRQQGVLGYGEGSKWDDRKYRINPVTVDGNRVIIPIGLTYFGASAADIDRTDEGNRHLQALGNAEYQDHWAFFARAIGVTFVPITLDGVVFMGERLGRLYQGWLNTAAGGVDYAGNPTLDLFERNAVAELKQEYGKRLQVLESRFVGIASHSLKGDADMVWVGRIDADSSYFESGKWLEEREDKEHAPELVSVGNIFEQSELLVQQKGNTYKGRTFCGLMPPTRLGLEALTEEDFM